MKKEYIGIHIGKKFLSAARIENKSLAAFTKLSLSSLREESGDKVLQEDVLWEALINKALREVGSEHNEVFVSLEDREFIFRSFDMPLISKKEIESSMNYEIEKYIPFKMEELIWDYSYTKVSKYKKIDLSFIGIKNTAYKKYKTLFANTNATVLNIEPSAISLARVIKSLKFAKRVNNFAVLDFSEGESYMTFFYNDLPVFNRFIGSFDNEKDKSYAMDRLVEEMMISIQYFRREFKNYDLNSLFILCSSENVPLLSALKHKANIESKVISSDDILDAKGLSMEHFKAYAAATVSVLPFRFKPKFQSKDELAGGKTKKKIYVPSFNYILISVILVVGAAGCIFLYSFLNNKIIFKEYILRKRIEKLVLPETLKNKPIAEVENYLEERIKKNNDTISRLKIDSSEYNHVYPILDELPNILAEGLWLSDFRLERDGKGKLKLALSGYVLIADTGEGRRAIDNFISSIKGSSVLHRYFPKIDLVSMGRVKIEGYDAITFSLKLE